MVLYRSGFAIACLALLTACGSPRNPADGAHGVPQLSKPALAPAGNRLVAEGVAPEANELKTPEPPKTVADSLRRGCSTKIVAGLSEQIIAEANCLQKDTFAEVPQLPNITFDESVFPYMQKSARDALVKAIKAKKGRTARKLTVTSMLRTVAQQYLLYDWYRAGRCGIKLAAKPGKSNHQGGLALDIREVRTWRTAFRRAGFRWLGRRDRWHFDYRKKSNKVEGLDVRAFQRLWNRNHPDRTVRADGDFGPSTEEVLREAPAAGFPVGAVCSAE